MYQDIKEQFKEVISYSQDIPNPQVDILFSQWLEAKRDVIEAFGGKLIYEIPVPVHFHLGAQEKKNYFMEFVDHVAQVSHNEELVRFLEANGFGSFYDNIIPSTYIDGDIKVPCGMKMIKAFKYFEKDQRLLEQLQNHASQLIQEDKIEGTLCFSVHPLDYLSTSCNTYNWRSCHALDGEFRAGNLSYMIDKSTVICYLKGADNVIIPSFPNTVPWNSKKWRVLLYLSDNWDMIFAGRQYPFNCQASMDIVLRYFLKALKLPEDRFDGWHNDYVSKILLNNGENYTLSHRYLPIRHSLYEIENIVQDGKHSLQFNDLLNSSTYKEPLYAIKDNTWWFGGEDVPHFEIGKVVGCLNCEHNRIIDSEMMVCRDCAEELGLFEEEGYACECCGRRIYEDEEVWWVNDLPVCSHCYDEQCFTCDICGDHYFNEDKVYDSQYGEICIHCHNFRKDNRD